MDADPSKYNVNKRNRCFVHGPAVGDDLRRLVVTLIMEAGGNPENRFIPYGVLSRVADSVKLANIVALLKLSGIDSVKRAV